MRTWIILVLVTATLAGCTSDDADDDLSHYLLSEEELPEGSQFGPPDSDVEQPRQATDADLEEIRASMEQQDLDPQSLEAAWSEFILFGPMTQGVPEAVSVSLLQFTDDAGRDAASDLYLEQGDAACQAGQATMMFHDPQVLLSLHGDPAHIGTVEGLLTDKTPTLEAMHRQVDCEAGQAAAAPQIAFTKDETEDRLEVTQVESDTDWGEFTIYSDGEDVRFDRNGGERHEVDESGTVAGQGTVEATDLLRFCVGGAPQDDVGVAVAHEASQSLVYEGTFTELSAC